LFGVSLAPWCYLPGERYDDRLHVLPGSAHTAPGLPTLSKETTLRINIKARMKELNQLPPLDRYPAAAELRAALRAADTQVRACQDGAILQLRGLGFTNPEIGRAFGLTDVEVGRRLRATGAIGSWSASQPAAVRAESPAKPDVPLSSDDQQPGTQPPGVVSPSPEDASEDEDEESPESQTLPTAPGSSPDDAFLERLPHDLDERVRLGLPSL